ncbi:pentapeptide repeat-containing protein [Streptomyces albus]|uniref:pentapeptide repeat-containing protein n=1 Tax=Streptomyces albus TaxID=1888 RepID=UPI0033F1EC6A
MNEEERPGRSDRLRADCERCAGLCCVALPFAASADFAVHKPAGQRCGNLTAENRCSIHARLRESGFAGCSVFDCYGAGQRVSARATPRTPGPRMPESLMFAVFRVTRQLHELLWLLTEAEAVEGGGEAGALAAELDALIDEDADTVLAVDVEAWRARVGPVLERVSERARRGLDGRDLARADLMGARLRGARLRGAGMRGALLIAADLRGADLRQADLLGADLRDADVCGADLSGALFLTQPQLNAAHGDSATLVPDTLVRPAHWPDTSSAGQHDAPRHRRDSRRGAAGPAGGGGGRRSGHGKRTGRGADGERNGTGAAGSGDGGPGNRAQRGARNGGQRDGRERNGRERDGGERGGQERDARQPEPQRSGSRRSGSRKAGPRQPGPGNPAGGSDAPGRNASDRRGEGRRDNGGGPRRRGRR